MNCGSRIFVIQGISHVEIVVVLVMNYTHSEQKIVDLDFFGHPDSLFSGN